jgi:hypothetical protein
MLRGLSAEECEQKSLREFFDQSVRVFATVSPREINCNLAGKDAG